MPIIALAQINYFDISKHNNIEKIKKYIRLAKKAKADLVCFPESCVHRNEVLNLKHKLIQEIKEECKKNSIWCIISEDIFIKKKHHNVAILINREGKIKGIYKKMHLYDEDNVIPGNQIAVFQTDFAKIGIVLCWDLKFSELFKRMKARGAEIVFCPAQWCYEEEAHDKNHKKREIKLLESLIRARAFENIYFVALCNPVMKREDLVSYSAIASPHKILNEIIDREGIITARINLKEIKKLHRIYNK